MSVNQYYVVWQGQSTGPFSFEQIKQQVEQGQISLSHQINDGGNMVFAEDFLEKKEAEAQAQAAAEQSQIEHNRQKELLDAQARTAEAQALTAQATAQAQPPALEGDQAPPVLSENTPPHLLLHLLQKISSKWWLVLLFLQL